MKGNKLLIEAYNFVADSPLFPEESVFEWCQRLSKLYDQGNLYASYHSSKIIALAGAFRIEEWSERWLTEIPASNRGRKLFIAFFISECNQMTDAIKMLRAYLRENPDIEEIYYCEKNRRLNHNGKVRLRRHRVAPRKAETLISQGARLNSPRIFPPELVALPDFQ